MNMINKRERLVVVGNGMAGMRTVEELLKRDPLRYQITVFGAEPHVNYDRIALSSVLAGEKEIGQITIHSLAWYGENGVQLQAGDPIVAIDREAKTVTSESGRVEPYDKLLLAMGSKPIVPPIPGLELPGVCAFRDIADVEQMIAASTEHRRAIVIGGGLLGLEAANGLMKRGMAVAVVHLAETLMERQLDTAAGRLLQRELTERGLNFFTNGQTEEIFGEGRAEGVRLADGREVPGDLVCMAIGIRPAIELAKTTDLDINRGIVVHDDLRTSDPDIFAVGECAEHRGKTYGLVAPLYEMAKICADHLARDDAMSGYTGTILFTKLKVTGVDLFSAGALAAGEESGELTYNDTARQVYKKLIVRDGKIDGVVLYGDVADSSWYLDMLRSGEDITPFQDAILFGQSVVAAMGKVKPPSVGDFADSYQICGCNGVCKGTITEAIADKGLTTLEEVRLHTKASASCGSCTGLVESLLAATAGAAAKPKSQGMCRCTDLTHEAVRGRIVAEGLQTIPDVMRTLDWKNPDGCHSCRPALNFYLLCAWPGDYRDDAQSRFINERAHANIQKDGTFSVIPRMWGGVTNAKELRAIADVVDRYDIPSVKVTGGQRIDMLGVPKDQLPAVWRDLNAAGMVSGHAYGKALRTVKTCVGSEWCRFGTQDSTGMGVALEKMTWGSWHPHKVKLAVSGCPRNCAESTIKDFGVIAVDSGWELHVGGNGGIKLRGTDLLCKVDTHEEVLEYCGAFLQLYREEARYLDRTAPWIERVGLDYVKSRIVEDEAGRKELHARFLHAQQFAQTDPWEERANSEARSREFHALAQVA
ncbi:MAG TPA: nitrite reductase large subunit NirB [Alphaproteobacteria bacterium]|jgi:nitrite reductase (NADH) large subunit|nr:nitrite reductase large subunit NirB [Alphaproteobacteria bacterium]